MGKISEIYLIIHFRSYRNGTAQENCADHGQKPICLHFDRKKNLARSQVQNFRAND